MLRIFTTTGLILVLAAHPAAAAMSDADCNAAWTKADTNSDGFVTEAENPRYFASLRVANKPLADGRMSKASFLEYCKADLFVSTKIDPGAPLSGSNSFTEGQAKDRIIATGLMNVSALQKDPNGVWRGTAMDGTKSVTVAVDYKGNVVTN